MHSTILQRFTSDDIIDKLEKFIGSQRHARIASVLQSRLESIELAIESPANIHNALAAVRSAEAMGVFRIHIIAPEGEISGMRGITQGAFHWVEIHYHDNLENFIKYCRKQSLKLYGGILNAAQTISDVTISERLCLLFGNENRGLSAAALSACHGIFTIPMYGMSESLNLSVSAAIALYDTTQRKRALLQSNGDLSATTLSHCKAIYYLNSVNNKLKTTLFK